MLRHVVIFKWKDGTTAEQVRAVRDALATLPSQIPEIRAYSFGEDLGHGEQNLDFAVVGDFDDRDAWVAYQQHPHHQRVIQDHMLPIVAQVVRVQFETNGEA